MTDQNKETCCAEFNPKPWDKVMHEWKDKLFLVKTVPQFLHMPLPGIYGKAITGLYGLAKREHILPETTDVLLLAFDPSPWKSELYLTVTEERPGLPMVKLSGTFASRVFDGPYNAVPSFIKEMDIWLAETGKYAKKYFFFYTTCPKCAKKYGHNYIVTFAEI